MRRRSIATARTIAAAGALLVAIVAPGCGAPPKEPLRARDLLAEAVLPAAPGGAPALVVVVVTGRGHVSRATLPDGATPVEIPNGIVVAGLHTGPRFPEGDVARAYLAGRVTASTSFAGSDVDPLHVAAEALPVAFSTPGPLVIGAVGHRPGLRVHVATRDGRPALQARRETPAEARPEPSVFLDDEAWIWVGREEPWGEAHPAGTLFAIRLRR